jgi:SAM-dependent methyltransferase
MIYRLVTECPFCGSNGPWDTAYQPITQEEVDVYERDENRYSICRCGGHFQNPMLTDDSIAKLYQGLYRSIHPDIKFINPRAERIFPHLPQKVGDMLDVGCSDGSLMSLAKEAGWRVWGVEPDDSTRRKAQKIGYVYKNLEEVDRTFDLVASVHVLEHVSEPIAFLRRKAELVNSDGSILVVVPYYNHRSPHLLAMNGRVIRELFGRIGIINVDIELYDIFMRVKETDEEYPEEFPINRKKTYYDIVVKASVS